MPKITEQQKADALMHAAALEGAFHVMMENAGRRRDIDRAMMETLAKAALILSGEYLKIVNTGEIAG